MMDHVNNLVACWGHRTIVLSHCRTIEILFSQNNNTCRAYMQYGVVVRQNDSATVHQRDSTKVR